MKRLTKKATGASSRDKPKAKAASESESEPKAMIGTKEKPLYIDESLQSFMATEEGYASDEDLELIDNYKSPLAEAPSYHTYLSIVPDYGDDEEDGHDGGGACPKPGEIIVWIFSRTRLQHIFHAW